MGFTTFNRRDAQRFRKVYPRIRKTPRFFTISDEAMSVESTKVSLENQTQGEFVFQLEYETIPTVVLTAETSDPNVPSNRRNLYGEQFYMRFVTSGPQYYHRERSLQGFRVGSNETLSSFRTSHPSGCPKSK